VRLYKFLYSQMNFISTYKLCFYLFTTKFVMLKSDDLLDRFSAIFGTGAKVC